MTDSPIPGVMNQVLRTTGPGVDFVSVARKRYTLRHGMAMQVRFKADSEYAEAYLRLSSNVSAGENFGIQCNETRIEGHLELSGASQHPALLPILQQNTWYVLRIVVDDVRGSVVEVSQENNPAVRASTRFATPGGRTWRFEHFIKHKISSLDNYQKLPAQAFQETFVDKNSSDWVWNSSQTVPFSDGANTVVKNAGNGTDFNAYFRHNSYTVTHGNAMQLRFKVSNAYAKGYLRLTSSQSSIEQIGIVLVGTTVGGQY